MEGPRPAIPLGQLVLQRGLLTEEQLENALAEHLASGKLLGCVLVEHGYLTEDEVEALLEVQRAENAEAESEAVRGIDLLRTRVAEAEAELDRSEPRPEDTGEGGHLLFVWSAGGYALLSRAGDPPLVGSEVGVSGGRLVVDKIGPSPLPGDRRPCAFLGAPS